MPKPSTRITRARSRVLAVGLALAALVVIFVATPAKSLALGFLEAFESQRVAPLALTPDDIRQMRLLPGLDEFGTIRQLGNPQSLQTEDFAKAARAAGFALRAPSYLPAGMSTASISSTVIGQAAALFTFDQRRAAYAAHAHGYVLPAMPAGMDRSTLQMTVGPMVITTVGGDPMLAGASGQQSEAPSHVFRAHLASQVIVAQAVAPKIATTGVSAATLESYLLEQPGISRRLAAEISALGNPATTLPIPIPIDSAYAQPATVHGYPAIGLGDNTGIGSLLVWEERGIVYAVGGAVRANELVRVAESMR